MDKEKEIEEIKSLLLKKSSLANVEPVFTDENGNEYTIDNEKALKVLNDILEQAFIPFVAEQVINAGYGNVAQAVKEFAEKLKDKILSLHCCDMATTEHEYYDMALSDVTYDIDNLFKELYGEGKE